MPGHDHSGDRESKPMIVFAGRSNVGKSSLIRALTGRRLRVGKKPGSTRWEQFVDLGSIVFVDIPGFGYMARQSKKAIEETKTLVIQKLEKWSSRLVLAVLVIDTSLFRELVERWEGRGEIPIDVEFYGFLSEIAPNVIVVANKIDKVKRPRREECLEYLRAKLTEAVTDKPPTVLTTVASRRIGTAELKSAIELVLTEQEIPLPDW